MCLLLAAYVIFLGRKQQANYVKKYPKFPCAPFYDTYGEHLETFAANEYKYNVGLEAQFKPFQFVGYLQCFCKDQDYDGWVNENSYGDG